MVWKAHFDLSMANPIVFIIVDLIYQVQRAQFLWSMQSDGLHVLEYDSNIPNSLHWESIGLKTLGPNMAS